MVDRNFLSVVEEHNATFIDYSLEARRFGVGSFTLATAPPPPSFTNTKSIIFDGVDEKITFGNVANIANNLTISAWVKHTDVTAIFVSKFDTIAVNRQYYMAIVANKLQVLISNNGSGDASNIKRYNSTNTIGGTIWVHVAFTFVSDVLKLYINGAEETTIKDLDATVNTIHTSLAGFQISGFTVSDAFLMNGSIDEVGVWSSVLTNAEITEIYNGGTPTDLNVNAGDYTSKANLVDYWRFDDDIEPNILDRSVNNNTGTMVNMEQSDLQLDVPPS